MFKRILLLFFLGILSSSNHRTYAFWEDTFTFKNSDGDIITIKKSQSYCKPKEKITSESGEYGTEWKTFYIYPLCVFKGTLKTFAGLTYKYENSENCDTNRFLCKAAGEFGLLKNYWSKKERLEIKIQKEIDEFNKDFKQKERLAKQLFDEKQREKKINNLLSAYYGTRSACYRWASGEEYAAIIVINEACTSYIHWENSLINEGIELPLPSFASQLPEKYRTYNGYPVRY